ncbi:MAG: DUF3368 domain-containing protein [Cyanobacteriota bacterium]|nr:DUF3368 domain-containing protein [Cyanobacteriota bacterium]
MIDERLGRNVAVRYGLEITGVLGVLSAAKRLGLIPLVKPILDNMMQQASFRVGRPLYEQNTERRWRIEWLVS